jgi:hypothetical protein
MHERDVGSCVLGSIASTVRNKEQQHLARHIHCFPVSACTLTSSLPRYAFADQINSRCSPDLRTSSAEGHLNTISIAHASLSLSALCHLFAILIIR